MPTYPAIVTTHLQANTDPGELPGVTSAWASLVTATVPLGVALGGPLVGVLGPRAVLLLSGGTTLLLALAGSVLVALPTRGANVLSLTATERPTKTPGS